MIESYRYDAFGAPKIFNSTSQPIDSSTVGNRFMFTGREYAQKFGVYEWSEWGHRDMDGQAHEGSGRVERERTSQYRNRAYHPGLGRFTSEDPLGFAAGDNNLFRYCGNDPVDRVDPDGMMSISAWAPAGWYRSYADVSKEEEARIDAANNRGQPAGNDGPTFNGKIQWEKPGGNWRDPNANNHVSSDLGTDYGQTRMSKPKAENNQDGSLKLQSELNWYVRKGYQNTKVSLAEINDHVRSWRIWQTEPTWGDGYTAVKNFKFAGSAKDAAAKLSQVLARAMQSENIRQQSQYDFSQKHSVNSHPELLTRINPGDIGRAISSLP